MDEIAESRLPEIKGSGFLERPPLIRAIPGTKYRRFLLYEPVIYDIGYSESDDRITVPSGFTTDFATIPRILWAIWPPMGQYSGAAILHDYLYASQKRSRKRCDDIFMEAMIVLGVSKITRYALFYAVRSCGCIAWNNKKRIC